MTDISVLNGIVQNETQIYTDADNPLNIYVEYQNYDNIWVFEPIDSTTFSAFLGCRYREITNDMILPDTATCLAIHKQEAIAYRLNPVRISRRLSGSIHEGEIAYFLSDTDWRMIHVTPEQLEIGYNADLKFLKSPMDLPQAEPITGGSLLKLLKPYVNLNDDDFKLFCIALVQAFSRSCSHFAFVISSAKGTGKSTLTRLIRELVEPSQSDISIMPTNENDLKVKLAANYVVNFDNTKPLSENVSNLLCAAVTGTKDVRRKLYTDSDTVVLDLHNFLVLNGINIIPEKSDLVERSLLFELQPIPSAKRLPDSTFWNHFNKAKPRILGAIFSTLSDAMKIYPSLTAPADLHRMADANLEMLAIAEALSIPAQDFQTLLLANTQNLKKIHAAENPFVSSVANIVRRKKKINGSVTAVFTEIYESIPGNRNFFPSNAAAFSRKLNEEIEALENEGIRKYSGRGHDSNTLLLELIPQNQQTKAQRERIASALQAHDLLAE